jgi:hypothetical protein
MAIPASRFGTWHFRFGGVDHESGALPYLQDIAAGSRALVAELVVTTDGDTIVLHRMVLKARRSYRLTLQMLADFVPHLCSGALRRFRLTGLTHCAAGHAAGVGRRPRLPGAMRLLGAQIKRVAAGAFDRLFVNDVWTVGIIDLPVEQLLAGAFLPTPSWLDTPATGSFHADPFPFQIGGREHLIFEMYDTTAERGWVAAAPLEGGRLAAAPVAIDAGCHMSYPAIFEHGGATYCAPEMSEAGGLRLYRMGTTAWEWTLVAHLLEGVPLIDPTLVEHEGRWWLLATLAGPTSDVDLHAWYAPTPFGPWEPHVLNPLKSDVRAARPAGAMFQAGGALYRPAQDCTFGYGGAVVLNRVLRLDPFAFAEVEALRLVPDPSWAWPDGLHTFNPHRGRIVIDAKRRVISPISALRRLPYMQRKRVARVDRLSALSPTRV